MLSFTTNDGTTLQKKKPFVLAICGEGEVGKDLAAEFFSRTLGLKYKCSTSYAAADLIFQEISSGKFTGKDPDHAGLMGSIFTATQYKTVQECYEDRRYHRPFWAEWIRLFNEADGTGIQLYRRSIELFGNQILTGIRKRSEFDACMKFGLIDCSLGIIRDGVKPDPTFEYSARDCDFMVYNPSPVVNGLSVDGIRKYFKRLERIATLFHNSYAELVNARLLDVANAVNEVHDKLKFGT